MKSYVVPNTQVFYTETPSFLVASGDVTKKYFKCPLVPDTRCDIYNEYAQKLTEQACSKVHNEKVAVVALIECPFKKRCRLYYYHMQAQKTHER